MSRYTFAQKRAQKFENYKYTFNTTQFLYKNGLYIVIILIFIALCIITPVVKNTQLLTTTNILNILQQASPRMFLALGVAGLILLTGTDLSVGRMVGMGMVTATIIMHNGINTGGVFGHIFLTLPVSRLLQEQFLHWQSVLYLQQHFLCWQASLWRSSRCIRLFQQWQTC